MPRNNLFLSAAWGIGVLALIGAAVFFFFRPSEPERPAYMVVGSEDGETLLIRTDKGVQALKLAEVRCPDIRQPWGWEARVALEKMAFAKKVTYEPADPKFDREGVQNLITEDGINVARELLRQGLCWPVLGRENALDHWVVPLAYREEYEDAKKARRGIWSDPEGTYTTPEDWWRGIHKMKEHEKAKATGMSWLELKLNYAQFMGVEHPELREVPEAAQASMQAGILDPCFENSPDCLLTLPLTVAPPDVKVDRKISGREIVEHMVQECRQDPEKKDTSDCKATLMAYDLILMRHEARQKHGGKPAALTPENWTSNAQTQ